MLKRIFAIGLTAVAFGSLAFMNAGSEALAAQEGYRPIEQGSTCARQLTFEELQEACQNPHAVGWQRAPKWINISCTRTDVTWKEKEIPVTIELPVSSSLDAALSAEKPCVSDAGQKHNPDMIVVDVPCREFTEHETTYRRDVNVYDCNELLSYSSVVALCDAKMKGARGAWSFVGARATGSVVNTCNGAMQARPPQQ